jgi:Ca2+-binding EF-hand superfamily protein
MGSTASLPSQEKLRKIIWLKIYNKCGGNQLVEDTLDDVFNAEDANHDGQVGKKEFEEAAKLLGFEVGENNEKNSIKLDEMMAFFDADHNGQISLAEFKDFVSDATKDFEAAENNSNAPVEKTKSEQKEGKRAAVQMQAEMARQQKEFYESRGERVSVGTSAMGFKVFMNLAVKSVVHEQKNGSVFDTVAMFAKESAESNPESAENKARRKAIRSDPEVVEHLKAFFMQASTLCDADHDGKFNKPEYAELHRRLLSAMLNEGSSGPFELIALEDDDSLEGDWTSDSKGDGFVDQDDFMDSMYEIADMWCESCDLEEYVQCLDDLRSKIFGDARSAKQKKADKKKADKKKTDEKKL